MNRTLDVAGFHLTGWEIVGLGVGVLVLALIVMRVLNNWKATVGVRMATVGAVMCTAVSTNTSWRYFGTHLGVTDTTERTLMFATAEVILFGLAMLTREKYQATKGETGGPAGVLVWVISGIACVPAFAEGGVTGGFVRAALGPIFAAVLWHLAMGIELVHSRPEGASEDPKGTLARVVKFVREAALATLGLAEPDRDAKEIRMDRAAARAVRLADEYGEMSMGERRKRHGKKVARQLRNAVRVAEIGSDDVRRERLMQELAATRNALKLATIDFPAPWAVPAAPTRLALEALAYQRDADAELAGLLDGQEAAETSPGGGASRVGSALPVAGGTGSGGVVPAGVAPSQVAGSEDQVASVVAGGGLGRVAGRQDAAEVAALASRPWEAPINGATLGQEADRVAAPPAATSLVNGATSATATATPVATATATPTVAKTGGNGRVAVSVTLPAPREADREATTGGDPNATGRQNQRHQEAPFGVAATPPVEAGGGDRVALSDPRGGALTEGPWTETRWTPEMAEAALRVIQQWKDTGTKPTGRAFVPALRAENVQISTKNAWALYAWAIAPDTPEIGDVPDDEE